MLDLHGTPLSYQLPCTLTVLRFTQQWQSEKVDFMLIKGAGPKAFCAGGDVVAITRPDCDLPSTFFGEEYALDYEIGYLGYKRNLAPFPSPLSPSVG